MKVTRASHVEIRKSEYMHGDTFVPYTKASIRNKLALHSEFVSNIVRKFLFPGKYRQAEET